MLGLPGLSQVDQTKVDAANNLADFTVSMLALALRKHSNSWMWSVLAHYVRSRQDPGLAAAFSNLHRVPLSMCMWGGRRPKNTLLLCTSAVLSPMALQCSGDHQHLPFKLRSSDGSWVFDTASEAEYPFEFCRKFASLLSPPSERPLELPLPRSTTRQKASRAPLVPEYSHVTTMKPAVGDYKSLLPKGVSGSESGSEKFGVFHSKEQFLAKAITAQHPFDSDCCIDDQTRRSVFDLLTGGLNKVSRARLHTASKISRMSKELEPAERAFQDTLTGHAKQVLEGKRVILWRKLLQETDFPDASVASLIEGVDLVGKPSKSPLYAWKEVLPTCTPEELVHSAAWKRKSLQQRTLNSSSDASLDGELWKCTMNEVSRGFLKGPFEDEDSVRSFLGVAEFCASRRFLVVQGTPENPKYRPIDDLKESGINSAYHSLERLVLHDVDYFVALCNFVARAVTSEKTVAIKLLCGQVLQGPVHADFSNKVSWVGRCLDLEKAYKQVPISKASLPYSVLMVRRPEDNKVVFFVMQSLPFGACSAVFSFNRISRSLHHLCMHLCKTIGGVFFDDFPLLEPSLTARMASLSVEGLLSALGWKYAQGSDKGIPFAESFDLLGVRLEVDALLLGRISLENKPGRVTKLLDAAASIKLRGTLSKAEAQTLQGQLNFMVGFTTGRTLKVACRAIANLLSGQPFSRRQISLFGAYLESTLRCLKPRQFRCADPSDKVLVFTDAAFEGGQATWGVVILDLVSNRREVSGGVIPRELVDFWLAEAGEQVITQAEAFAMVLARIAYGPSLSRRRSIWFVDNEACRCAMIKGASPSRSLLVLVQCFLDREEADQSLTWIERVPSASNIADLPSRDLCEQAASIIRGRVVSIEPFLKSAVSAAMRMDNLPWDMLCKSAPASMPSFFLD